MRKSLIAFLLVGVPWCAQPLAAQQPCPGFSIIVNTPEDELMLAVNGAENPQEQVAALDKFVQEHSDSKFMPCVNEYYTTAYLKLNNFDKAIEYGEKDLAANYQDVNLILNVERAFVASNKADDSAFAAIFKAPDQIKAESNPSRPPNVSDADWQKSLQDLADQVKEESGYMEYAFFQLLPRVSDANKRVQLLDAFMKAYPNTQNTKQVNFQYLLAYKMANDPAKADEYGEKSIASDPNNVVTLNVVADDYAMRQTNLDKASEYAKRVLELAPSMPKPEGMSDEQFKSYRDSQLGYAHLTLGYVAQQKAAKSHRVAPAIQEYKTAVDLLASNPGLEGRALFYLGYAYEVLYPPNHKLALDALGRAASFDNPWQGQAKDLLAKVKKAPQE